MKHDFIKTGDPDSFAAIQDHNGEVVLGYCRRCRCAEGELTPACYGVITAENITDEQIRELQTSAAESDDLATWTTAQVARGIGRDVTEANRQAARARCADILNRRARDARDAEPCACGHPRSAHMDRCASCHACRDCFSFTPVRGAEPTKGVLEGQEQPGGRTGGATPPTGAKICPQGLVASAAAAVPASSSRWIGHLPEPAVAPQVAGKLGSKPGLAQTESKLNARKAGS